TNIHCRVTLAGAERGDRVSNRRARLRGRSESRVHEWRVVGRKGEHVEAILRCPGQFDFNLRGRIAEACGPVKTAERHYLAGINDKRVARIGRILKLLEHAGE